MRIHKLLRGSNAGLYLPFALARLRNMESMDPKACFAEKHVIGGYTIRVWQCGEDQYLDISAIAACYEFYTAEHVLEHPIATPGHESPAYVCGSGTRVRFNQSKTVVTPIALFSSSIAPLFDQSFAERDCEADQASDAPGNFITWPAWQNQKFTEHHYHPDNGSRSLVTSCQAQMPGLNSQANWSSPYTGWRIANASGKTADYQFDIFPAYYNENGVTRAAPQMDHGWTWWRHAAVAKSDLGNLFFISTDNYGRFQVYRVQDYRERDDICEVGRYQMLTPPYPGWVTLPDPGNEFLQVNHWLWRFNKDATKCVSCPFHAEPSPWLKYYFWFQGIGASAILPENASRYTPDYALIPAHEDTPGLVEFGIEIIETGPGDLEFTVNFTLLRQSYFPTTGRYFMDAAYALPNVPGVDEDQLVTLEMECLMESGHFTAGPITNVHAFEAIDGHHGVKCSIVMNVNTESMARTEKYRFITQYPMQGQFPTIASIREDRIGDAHAGSGDYLPKAAGGTEFVEAAGPVNYDPEDRATDGFDYGMIFGFLSAVELSTLSIVYEEDNYIEAVGRFRAFSHGVTLHSEDFSLAGHPWVGIDPGYAVSEIVPSARVHDVAVGFTVSTAIGMQFAVHPEGHFSFSANMHLGYYPAYGYLLDWISVVGKDEEGNPVRTRFRHKDMFNQAFGQNRDYDFYSAFTTFPGKGNFDQGSFRIHGIWVTFR